MSSRFRIADLTLDTGRRLLLCDSKPIALGPLTYRLLLTLVEAAPDVVTHDQLVAAIWDGRPVSPETISQRIKLLRDALGDDPHHPRYIEVVQQAIAIDSRFIPAYCGLGLAYVHEVVDVQVPMTENRERLRELVSRGLRLAPHDPGLLALSAQC